MNKRIMIPASVMALFLLVLGFQAASAHEEVAVGDYDLEVGWLNEPPITGQLNGITVSVTKGEDAEPVEDVLDLTVTVFYGDQSKGLILQPLGEEAPGQFVAPILPVYPGQYTVHLGGKLGDTDVNVDVQPEAVDEPYAVQFPIVDEVSPSSAFGLTGWLAVLGVVFGLAGMAIGVMALRKKK